VSTFHRTRTTQVQTCAYFSSYQNKTGTGLYLLFVIPEQNRYRPLLTFRRTRTKQVQACAYFSSYQNKTGTGLCLLFVVPEQNQVQARVNVSSYQNTTRYMPVSTFRRSRTQHKTVKYEQLTVVFVTRKNPIFITTAYTRSAVFWVTTTCSLVGTYQR